MFFLTRVLPVALLLVIFYVIPVLGVPSRKPEPGRIPTAIRVASWIEAIFGIMLFFSGVLFAMEPAVVGLNGPVGATYALLFCLGSGIAWLVMATHINFGNKRARGVCLVLSILRVFTVVGAVFSIVDIALLYGSRSSRQYYAQ